MSNSLHWLDGLVIVLYLLGVTGLGIWSGRRISRSQDFFMPRRFGKWMMIMHAFGTGTASDQAVTVASATARNGVSGIWFQWFWLMMTPFYWLIAPIMRRFRATTTADVYELRYGRSVAMLFAVVGIASMVTKLGLMLKGAGALIESGTGGLVDANLAIVLTTVLFVAYGMAGGLGAAIVTDFVQGIMTLLFSFILLPFILNAVGGLEGVRTILEPAHADKLSLVAPGKIGVFWIVMMSLQVIVGIVAFPSAMGNCAAGKTELEGRVGYMCGTFIKRICTVAWCLTGIAALAWYLQQGISLDEVNADNVYGDVAYRFLPVGMLGVFIASLLAAIMSSCDSFMIAASALFTENLYRTARPDRDTRHYLWVGRVSALIIVLMGMLFAFWLPGVIAGLMIWLKIAPMMGVAFWLGLLWRGSTTAGAWASTVAGFGAWWLSGQAFFLSWLERLPGAEALKLITIEKGVSVMYEPWGILFYLSIATVTGVIVSLLTRSMPDERLDRFYQLTRTPIQDGEVLERACELPEGVIPVDRPMLLTWGGLEIPQPSRTSVVGFLAGAMGVVLLIGVFVWIAP